MNQQLEYVAAIGAVEVSGGLIRQQHRRLHHERARERDALLFAAGKLRGIVIAAFRQSDAIEKILGPLDGAVCTTAEFHRQHHVFKGGERRYQMIGLKYEAQLLSPQLRHLIFAKLSNVLAVNDNAVRMSANPGRQ